MLKFKSNLRIMHGSSFINSNHRAVFRFSLLFCSILTLLYDQVKHKQRFRCVPLIFRQIYTLGTYEKVKNYRVYWR